MIPAEVRAIVFDALGTLLVPDPPVADVYTATGQRFGSRLSREAVMARFRLAIQHEEAVDSAAGLRTSEERERQRWRHIIGHVLDDVTDREACFLELFTHFARPEAWRCADDVADVLSRLRERGYRLGVGSNWDGRLHAIVAGKPELRLLTPLVVGSEVGWRKPSARFYQAITDALGLTAAQVLFVGDDPVSDYGGARVAGMPAILLDSTATVTYPVRPYISRLSALLG